MDKRLRRLIAEDTPKVNPAVVNGIATKAIPAAEEYIDTVFRSTMKASLYGLEYIGCERCTPIEEFNEATRKRGTRRQFDIARSDIYLMRYNFRYNGKELPPRYLYLPFVSQAGTIILSGSRYLVSPVLNDKVFSIGHSNIFVRLLRDKLNIEREPHTVVIDGSRETVQIVWSLIYHRVGSMKRLRATTKAKCSLVHYLLAKYGFKEMMQRFGNCDAVIGSGEINPEAYPVEEYVIIESTQIKPKGFGRGYYRPSQLRVAIPRAQYNEHVKNLVCGFFYVVDHFPDRIKSSWVDNTRLWIILMGHILFSGTISEQKLFEDVSDHFESLDEYIDAVVQAKLKDIGHEISDIYQLFDLIIANFNTWILTAADDINSMYGKELEVLYYVLYKTTSDIVKLHFKLKAASKKRELSEKEVISIMNMFLRQRGIFNITKSHVGVSTESYSGDNKFFKITSILVPQSTSNRMSGKKERAALISPANRLSASIAEVGGYANLPKAEPTGRTRINPHVMLDDRDGILRNDKFRDLLDDVERRIRRN